MHHLRFLLLWVHLIGLFFSSSSAWGFPGGSVYHEMPLPSSAPTNLLDGAGLVTFARAHQFVRSLDRASSCARQAAYGLIQDCSNVDSTVSEGHFALDAVKNLYAVRLAICEMKVANINVPSQCDMTVMQRYSDGALRVKGGASKVVAACVKALYAFPQSWTSYSNNRQNARLICQASRPEAEREEMVAMFKGLVSNQEASAETLLQQIQFSKQQLAEQKTLADEVMSFSRDMASQMQSAFEAALAGFVQLQSQAGATQAEYTQFFNELMLHTNGEMKSLVQGLQEQRSVIQEANSDIANLVSHLDVQGQEISSQWRQNIETNTQLELQAQNQLGILVLKHETLFSRLGESLVLAEASNREQQAAWAELRNGTNLLREAFGGLSSLVSDTTAALDGVSAYVGIISTLAKSFQSWLNWVIVAAVAVVSLMISLAFFGLKGSGFTTMIIACIAYIYVLVHDLGTMSSWLPLLSPSNLRGLQLDMLWKAASFVVVVGIMAILYQACACRAVHSLFRRRQSQELQELPISHYTPINSQLATPARPFLQYHPSTGSYLDEDNQICDDFGFAAA